MTHRTVICVLLVLLSWALLACSLFSQQDQPSEPTALPPPPPHGHIPGYDGPMSLEERIFASPVIARVQPDSVSSSVEVGNTVRGEEYIAVLEFSFTVLEYLKGNGGNNIVAVWDDAQLFLTRAEAEAALPGIAAARQDRWDGRQAIVFLKHSQTYLTSTQQAGRFYLSPELDVPPDDNYSLSSRYSKLWLPAESHFQPSGDQQRFLMDVPPSTGTAPTITLSEMKDRIATVTAKLNAGDGSPEYAECVRRTYWRERRQSYREVTYPGRGEFVPSGFPPQDHAIDSGLAAGSTLYEDDQGYGLTPDNRNQFWLDGGDADLFRVEHGEAVPYDSTGDGENDAINFTRRVVTSGPILEGVYRFHSNYRGTFFIPCDGYTLRYEWTVTVTAPDGTLHEAFFDPVTDHDAIAADSTIGRLEPASFFEPNGGSATIHRISYDSGAVTMTLSPVTAITGHTLDFIALDGSISLSLHAYDATPDTANHTLTWPVSEQPWHPGDKLMLRISLANP